MDKWKPTYELYPLRFTLVTLPADYFFTSLLVLKETTWVAIQQKSDRNLFCTIYLKLLNHVVSPRGDIGYLAITPYHLWVIKYLWLSYHTQSFKKSCFIERIRHEQNCFSILW